MDKETVPRWGWLLLGLLVMAFVSQAINQFVLAPRGLQDDYQVVTVITTMSPVLIYVGVWYDEDRRHYWEYPTARLFGDLVFVLVGAMIGSFTVLALIIGFGLPRPVQDILVMGGGFLLSWGLFWWRNPDLYLQEFGDESGS